MKKIHYLNPCMQAPMHPVTVCLVGCGGTGSSLLTQLGRIHYALKELDHPGLMVRVFDPDSVNPSNIGRQLFSNADIGMNKAQVLTSRLNRFYGTDWLSFPSELITEEIKSNILISCVDSVSSRKKIYTQIKKYEGYSKSFNMAPPYHLYYWMDTGNTRDRGQVVLGTAQKIQQPKESSFETMEVLPTIFDLHPDIEQHDNSEEQGPTCSVAEALTKQDLFINTFIAQFAGKLLFDLLNDRMTVYQGAYINLANYRTNPIRL
ncbi:MAG: PRTRC system ThiF family protein [Cyclobacteriaceae bacterium]|nr:PRTRC system ThiF family protein [Cyclobacteriaceae bacterium SS2]